MDWVICIENFFIKWFPWINFLNDIFFIQIVIFYILYNVYNNNNTFYTVFYLFFEIILFGVFLSFYQVELFTAFLWLTEFVVIFICILLAFYLNVYGNKVKINIFYFNFKNAFLILLFILFVVNYSLPSELEFFIPNELNSINTWDNFYESLYNIVMVDLHGLFVNYYFINNFEFIFIGLLLLIGSLVCVNLNKFSKFNKINSFNELFLIMDFFKDFVKFIFMRRQNLVDQENYKSATRIFKKKLN